MADDFAGLATALDSPARDASAVTPSDSQPLAAVSRALYVGGSGALAVEMLSGATVTLAEAQAGMIYPLRVRRVLATGTTASGIVALR